MSVAPKQSHNHLLCLREKPSFLPMRLMKNNEQNPMKIPVYCNQLSFSPNITTAPSNTSMGRVALIGPLMVMGKCFMEKYPKSHEESTMSDLMRISR